MKANEASIKQLQHIEGFLGGGELVDKGLVFWTLTLWSNEAAMRQFRNGDAHRKAMQRLPFWCSEASYTHWIQEEKQLPSWKMAETKMYTELKITKVRNPSANQINKTFPPIKWNKIARVLRGK